MKTTVNTSLRIRGSRGFGLVEIMVAIVISLLLVTIISEVVISSKRTYRTGQDVSRLQENARFAIHFITKDLRMAGYADCAPQAINNMLNTAGDGYSDTLFLYTDAVGGWEFANTAPDDAYGITTTDPNGVAVSQWGNQDDNDLTAAFQDKVVPGTDVLVIKKMGDDSDIVVKPPTQITQAVITTENKTNIPQYTIMMVTEDCIKADLFQKRNNAEAKSVSRGNGSSTNPGPGNISSNWSYQYDEKARFLFFESIAYYIGQGVGGEPALYRVSFNLGPSPSADKYQELVEGVENMQVLFGEDTDVTLDNVANRYVPIDQVTNPANIVSVRISLLMRTINEPRDVEDTKNDYLLTGSTTIDPQNDRRLRYVATTTVKLRNKGI